jgi:GH24 family phage-related lysozyme (muramidase)
VLAAFGDAVFNMGSTIACNREASSAARYLYKGQLLAACNELPKWNKARVAGVLVPLPGLTKRRAIEQEVCLRGLT